MLVDDCAMLAGCSGRVGRLLVSLRSAFAPGATQMVVKKGLAWGGR